jgi:hypothetical protein
MQNHPVRRKLMMNGLATLRVALLALGLVAASGYAASVGRSTPSLVPSAAPQAPDSMIGYSVVAPAMARLQQTNWMIWEYSDEQALNDGTGEYGPVAHVFPLDQLGTMGMGKFNVAKTASPLVGLIFVDNLLPNTTSLPTTYLNLHLSVGMNCLYVRHETAAPAGTKWHAYVLPAQPGDVPCAHVQPGTPELVVKASQAGGVGRGRGGFTHQVDYPAVARFHEGTDGVKGHSPVPTLGIKCYDRWCMILPTGIDSLPLSHAGVHKGERAWHVRGWHDEQHLAEPDAAGKLHPNWNFVASVVPDSQLGKWKVADYVHERLVARIHIEPNQAASSKYMRRKHLTEGDNLIYIQTRDATGKTWFGRLVNSKAQSYALTSVIRTDHAGHPVPPTARFKWTLTDEDEWVGCDTGCCYIRLLDGP